MRWQRRIFVYGPDLDHRGAVDAPGYPYAIDREGRLWCAARDTEVPVLERYRVVER
ncbi:MAG TPA: hypothetical protein VKA86_07190 [Candidatus Krumholzibacteria bacterium]|nr:hypothetical protein [Candidatus Krumholzibacteria bacterium]